MLNCMAAGAVQQLTRFRRAETRPGFVLCSRERLFALRRNVSELCRHSVINNEPVRLALTRAVIVLVVLFLANLACHYYCINHIPQITNVDAQLNT